MDAKGDATPPWGTKGLLNRAGAKIRDRKDLTDDETSALEDWRAAHSYVLNTFKPLLWSRVRGKRIVVAQRLKRRITIIDKLFREPKMELARMDDIAGCRLIFEDINGLEEFRSKFHSSRFNHKLKHEDADKYNYIIHPKSSGYRGVHEIYI
jgi:ppGpp synthetase/RelA/SpoT-type nucleotidyltranferase